MTTRNGRPQLQPPDLSTSAKRSSSAPSRIAADDPRFTAAAELETHDAYLRGVQEGRVRVVNPETVPPRPEERTQPPAKRRSPETSLSTKVPQFVMQQLRRSDSKPYPIVTNYQETMNVIGEELLATFRDL